MYSYEDRIRAVKLYVKYDRSVADTIRELGYPSRGMLVRWYKEYQENGDLHRQFRKQPRYSLDEMQKAVEHYLEHGRSVSRTRRALGYPARATLKKWIDELAPGRRRIRLKRAATGPFSREEKEQAVLELCFREGAADTVAERVGTSRATLYNWRKDLLGHKDVVKMGGQQKVTLPDDKDALLAELETLKKQIYRKRMELDILNMAAEMRKKGQGIGHQRLGNREKARLIDALRTKYPLNELLVMMNMPKSSYFDQREAQRRPDKHAVIRREVKLAFAHSKSRYGYRRIHAAMKNQGVTVSEKVVRRIMREEHLVVPYLRRRKYNSYMGEVSPAVENLVARDFRAEKPNAKWLTDLTEFQIPAGKVYLSPIVDCFDGLVVTWTIGTSPNAELVNTMLEDAIDTLAEGERPILHTDRGAHYRWPGWVSKTEGAGLKRSMSRKGCSPDNAACEGFFGRVKNEMFYHRSWDNVSVEQFIEELDSYLRWYNESRIKKSLGGMSPITYRRSLGLAA